MELLEASCFECEKQINKAERIYQTRMFDPIRYRLGISSKKRPASKRPTSWPISFYYADTKKTVVRHIPFSELPPIIMGLVWLPPGIWSGREEGGGTNSMQGRPMSDQESDVLMKRYGADGIRTPTVLAGTGEFFPALAKIAHSFGVIQYGLNGFYPFLIDFILQRPTDFPANYFIGGLEKDNGPIDFDRQTTLHWMNIVEYPFAGLIYLVAFISLFASYGFPVSQVVIGVRKDGPQAPLPEVV